MTEQESVKHPKSSFILPDQTCQHFTLAEIQALTHDFDEALVIGRGGFGKVYKCTTKIGTIYEVAIKRLHCMSNQGACEFDAEVNILSKIRHGNLVSLIGYCNEGTEMVLIYEFLPNGTLKDHIRKDDTELSWLQRLKICIGAARGLHYLHTGIATRHGVIHRDVKTSNILLDSNFEAKVSDFGLAKVGQTNQTITHVSTMVKGTFGYMDPSYFLSGKLTRKSDVYAFGVVLFEVLSGKQAVDPTIDEYQWSLAVWAQDQISEGKLTNVVDPKLKGQISKKSLKEFASVALDCLHSQPKKRPRMAEVVVKIESILSQERECTDSYVNEGTFINKLKSLFISKVAMMSSQAMESKYETMVYPVEKSSNQSWREFTRAEIVILTSNIEHEQCWVDERTYVPTECGTGLPIYVTREGLEMPELNPSFGKRIFVELKLEKCNHPNLIKLLGYCLDKNELYCVYELNPNTRLDRLLFKVPGTTSLPWSARLKIAIGAAQGLSFLHQRKHIAYIQLKTSVILVDKDYNARLSDFVVKNPFLGQYTYPFLNDAFYAAPEWFNYQSLKLDCSETTQPDFKDDFWIKSEIYAFGVVLLEMLTGMKVFDVNRSMKTQNLVKWAIPLLADEVNLGKIMDPQLQLNDCPPNGAFKFALLVSKCLQPKTEKRPSMEEIIQVYESTVLKLELSMLHEYAAVVVVIPSGIILFQGNYFWLKTQLYAICFGNGLSEVNIDHIRKPKKSEPQPTGRVIHITTFITREV